MSPAMWRRYSREYGYDLTARVVSDDDEPGAPPIHTADDALRAAVAWAKNRRLTLEQALPTCPFEAPRAQALRFAERLAEFKADNDVLDFPDMLEAALATGKRPPVKVAFVDEAQDLSPLQAALVEMWFCESERVYVAGDDDQAIYGFQGADPTWILSLASRGAAVETLRQSYRLPVRIHRLATRIIGQNRNRLEKAYEPRPEAGEVLELTADDVLDAITDAPSVLILARNRLFLGPWVRRLLNRAEPFSAEGQLPGVPLDVPGVADAIAAAVRLGRGEPITAQALRALLEQVSAGAAGSVLPRGTKARAARNQADVTRDVLGTAWGLGYVLDQIDRDGPASILCRPPAEQRQYVASLISRFGDVPTPRVRLLTIHGAKGREADTVVVIPDMSRAAYDTLTRAGRDAEEAEHRVAYVAVTRARRRLIVVEPTTRRYYPYRDFSRASESAASR
jgi:DNA helicase-2/ATP-dependent DNA helicase PcrA